MSILIHLILAMLLQTNPGISTVRMFEDGSGFVGTRTVHTSVVCFGGYEIDNNEPGFRWIDGCVSRKEWPAIYRQLGAFTLPE